MFASSNWAAQLQLACDQRRQPRDGTTGHLRRPRCRTECRASCSLATLDRHGVGMARRVSRAAQHQGHGWHGLDVAPHSAREPRRSASPQGWTSTAWMQRRCIGRLFSLPEQEASLPASAAKYQLAVGRLLCRRPGCLVGLCLVPTDDSQDEIRREANRVPRRTAHRGAALCSRANGRGAGVAPRRSVGSGRRQRAEEPIVFAVDPSGEE